MSKQTLPCRHCQAEIRRAMKTCPECQHQWPDIQGRLFILSMKTIASIAILFALITLATILSKS